MLAPLQLTNSPLLTGQIKGNCPAKFRQLAGQFEANIHYLISEMERQGINAAPLKEMWAQWKA